MTQQTHPYGQQSEPHGQSTAAYGEAVAPSGAPAHPSGPAPSPSVRGRGRRTGTIIGAAVTGLLVLIGLAVAALYLFGTRTLDSAEAEREIARLTEQEAGLAPAEVQCPADIAIEAGATFSCTGVLDGQPVSYSVRQTDDEGNVFIESDNTYVMIDKVQESLAEQVGGEAGVEVITSCDAGGRSVLVDGLGVPIPCTVASADDPTDSADVVATVDEEGAVSYTAP
jgi:hypothetical protein